MIRIIHLFILFSCLALISACKSSSINKTDRNKEKKEYFQYVKENWYRLNDHYSFTEFDSTAISNSYMSIFKEKFLKDLKKKK